MKKPLFFLIVLVALNLLFTNVSIADNDRTWMKVSGRFSFVEYPSGMEKTADSLLRVAEQSIPEICRMVGVPLEKFTEKPCRIILTDAPDVSNGYAVSNTVVIFATSSSYLPGWTGTVNWYHQVLTHELVHHITFRAFERSLTPIIGAFTVLDVPRWFLEGTAQYYSEYWNTYRGDLYLKNAVLEGKFNPGSINSLADGRLLYAGGHAYVRFLADQYGDSSLIKLMAYNQDDWIYSFDEAFKAVYKKSVNEMFPEFHRHLVLYYGSRMADYPVRNGGDPVPTDGFQVNQLIPVNVQDSVWIQVARLNKNHLFQTAREIDWTNKKPQVLTVFSHSITSDLLISPDKQWVAWGESHRFTEMDQDGLSSSWYAFNRKTNEKVKIRTDIRSETGALTDSSLFLVELDGQVSRILAFPLSGGLADTIFTTAMPIGRITPGKGELLMEVQRLNGHRDLVTLKNNLDLSSLTNDAADDRLVQVVNDSTVVFTRYVNHQPVISQLNRNTGDIRTYPDRAETFTFGYDSSAGILTGRIGINRKTDFSFIKPDSIFKEPALTDLPDGNARYASWTTRNPAFGEVKYFPDTILTNQTQTSLYWPHGKMENMFTLALPNYDYRGFLISGATAWVEPLQRQVFFIGGDLAVEKPEESILVSGWQLRAFDLLFTGNYYSGPAFFSFQGTDWEEAMQYFGSFQIQKSFYPSGSAQWTVTPGIGYLFQNRHFDEAIPGLPDEEGFHGIQNGVTVTWSQPTLWGSTLNTRQFYIGSDVFRSLDSQWEFTTASFNAGGGFPVLSERLGISARASYLTVSGTATPRYPVGIDRFYQYDVPRDYGLTRVVRGVPEDIGGKEVLWASANLSFLLAESTPLKLIVLPVNMMTLGGFYDFADVSGTSVWSAGGEVGFGEGGLRFNTGYAYAELSSGRVNETWYLQLRVNPFF